MSQGVYSTGPAAGSGTEATTVSSRKRRRRRGSGAVRFLWGVWEEGRRGAAEKWEEVVGVTAASNDMAKKRASGPVEEAVTAPAPNPNDRKRRGQEEEDGKISISGLGPPERYVGRTGKCRLAYAKWA